MRFAGSCALAVVLGTSLARAQPRHELDADPVVDLTLVGGGSLVLVGAMLLEPALAPESCRWCRPNPVDDAVRDALRWERPGAANVWSGATAGALTPAALGLTALAGRDAGASGAEIGVDLLLVTEAAVLAMDLNEVVKLTVGRERPFLRGLDGDARRALSYPANANLSFYSGHTTFAAALATSAGTVATLRGYRFAPAVWAVGAPLALATGYLRVAADRHYLSDVLTGLVLGSAVGVAVPLLHARPPSDGDPGSATAPLTVTVSGRF
jgi:membrane-associated phospholipid phosphatase